MPEQTKRVRFTHSTRDRYSARAYAVGQEKDLPASVADRFVSGGVAVYVEPEDLRAKTKAELEEVAAAAGVNLTGASTKAEYIERIEANYTGPEEPPEQPPGPSGAAGGEGTGNGEGGNG